MTPHRDRDEGTFLLDLRLGKLGRLKRASGTTDPALFADVKRMIVMLRKARRWDLLSLLVNRHIAPLELHDAFVRGEFDRLATADDLRPLRETAVQWIAQLDRAPRTIHEYEWRLRQLGAEATTLSQLPALLEGARAAALKSGKRSLFNGMLSTTRGLIDWALAGNANHPIHQAVSRIEELLIERREGNPQSVEDLRAIAGRMGELGPMVWAFALTGLRRTEYFARRFEVRADRIIVQGVKARHPAPAKRRVVFKAYPIVAPLASYDHFRTRLSDVTQNAIVIHDFRYTFMRWCGDAGIPERRIRWYVGHSEADVTDHYMRGRGFMEYLATDAERFRGFLGEVPRLGLEVMG